MATLKPVWLILAICLLVLLPCVDLVRKTKSPHIESISDVKDLKKLLRTRNNVLVLYGKSGDHLYKKMDLYGDVAQEVMGTGTVVIVDCSESKKLCKKMKASPSTVEIKHYKDGEYNRDYDRKDSVKSMVNFMRNPTGDMPWEEDATATDVVHVENKQDLQKLLTKGRLPTLLMFYAPWCGHCKRLKPEYASAATELKGQATMAAIDVDRPENMDIRMQYNITGFPTLNYYENGVFQYKYGGDNSKDGLVSWMKNPAPPKEPEKEPEWAETESDVVHLGDDTFDDYIASHSSVLVMFYAPWCGHCKKMKPEYVDAAAKLLEEEIEGSVAAVDATAHKTIGDRYEIKGYPTVKYFKDGEIQYDVNERTADKIVEFMKDPKEPPPPPPPEPGWDETESAVVHLTDLTFKKMLKKKKHALVMFYAPWCGHCKKAKPEYMQAAAKFEDDFKVLFAAMDCTKFQPVCSEYGVTGYPTFVYFNYGKDSQKYTGGREEADFVNFMVDPLNPLASAPPPPPVVSPEEQWSGLAGSEYLVHLTEANFDEFTTLNPSMLVMFYAPWCGHCKAMKPAYAEAASLLAAEKAGALAAVDCTIERGLAEKYGIKGFPTIKHFRNGEMSSDYNSGRSTPELVNFMKKFAPAQAASPQETEEVEEKEEKVADTKPAETVTPDKPKEEVKPEPVKQDSKPEPVKQDRKPEPVKQDTKPEPVKQDRKPEPVKQDTKPEPVKQDRKPEPVKQDTKPEPVKQGRKPEPVKQDRKPEPVKQDTKTEPVKEDRKPEPAKQDSKPEPVKQDSKPEPVKESIPEAKKEAKPETVEDSKPDVIEDSKADGKPGKKANRKPHKNAGKKPGKKDEL